MENGEGSCYARDTFPEVTSMRNLEDCFNSGWKSELIHQGSRNIRGIIHLHLSLELTTTRNSQMRASPYAEVNDALCISR